MNDLLKKVAKGDTPSLNKVLAELGVPELTEKQRTLCREMEEADLMALTTDVCMEQLFKMVSLAKRLQERCGVCRDSGTECAHCVADALQLTELLVHVAGLARFTAEATSPGTRISAQREARREADEAAQRAKQ